MITNKPYSEYELKLAADAYAQSHPRIAATFNEYIALHKKAANIASENIEIRIALENMLNMFNMVMRDGNHAASFYSSECIKAMNEAPIAAKQAIGMQSATNKWINTSLLNAKKQGVNFAASRLLAAWRSGFINKPEKDVLDIAIMILSATSELTTAPDDALSGVYARQVLGEYGLSMPE